MSVRSGNAETETSAAHDVKGGACIRSEDFCGALPSPRRLRRDDAARRKCASEAAAIDAEAAVKAGNLSAAGEALSVGPAPESVKALRYTMQQQCFESWTIPANTRA